MINHIRREPLTPRVKLRQNGIVSFLIRLADFQARGVALKKAVQIAHQLRN